VSERRPRLRDVWPFGRAKTPGYGIAKTYYLSVLAATARMPAILEVINPEARGGAVEGFGAPLAGSDKALLAEPMVRGGYVLATKDRKTVVKLLVLPRDEAGFDPDLFLNHPASAGLSDEIRARIRATWNVCQLTFESHDPAVHPAIAFFLGIAGRLASLTDGVVADPLSQRYQLPDELVPKDALSPVDARTVVRCRFEPLESGIYGCTLGMQKFVLPEFEISGIPAGKEREAEAFLLGVCQSVLMRGPIEAGTQVGVASAPILVAEGGLDRARWEGIPCFELIPASRGEIGEALDAWVRQETQR